MTVKNKIIMWALTYRCNMNCKYCYLKSARNLNENELSGQECLDAANKIVASTGWKPDAVWLTGGETTLNGKLCELITLFEANNIKTVVNTNGLIDEVIALGLGSAKPKGINISLDFTDTENDDLRGNTKAVVETVRYLHTKITDYTILGISMVITAKNAGQLYELSKHLENMGVRYMSLNPLFSKEDSTVKDQLLKSSASKSSKSKKTEVSFFQMNDTWKSYTLIIREKNKS